ncbi:MAG: DUF268 domain-containing protein [Firmicutes bacterium]|nr:DUF268 domain-containing protein [Bacillota bacterium]
MLKQFKRGLLANWITAFIDVVKILSIFRLPGYFFDFIRYHRSTNETLKFRDSYPCLADRTSKTPFDPHYFYQACWLSRRLARLSPEKHVDIGSHVQMIGVISGFVDTVFYDYRPLQAAVGGLECRQGDLLQLPMPPGSVYSLSCLHVIEHIGLGRYGDPLDPQGSTRACAQLERVLKPGGWLFVSVPVGRERVCFNAHRVFPPHSVLKMFTGLDLVSFSFVNDAGVYFDNYSLEEAANCSYGCGMFVFRKEEGQC